MKSIILSIACTILTLSAFPPAHINQFAGQWVNTDSNTRGLTSLSIEVIGKRLRIQAWGKCHPSDCAWGWAEGTVHTTSVEANPVEKAEAVTTLYVSSFSQTILIIRPIEGDRLQVETFNKFTDKSGRSDYVTVDTFRKVVNRE